MQPSSAAYLLEHVAGILHRQIDQILQERLGIGLSQLKILELLEHSSQIKQKSLARSLGQTEASVSRQIKLLQHKGMLLTQTDPQEHRRRLAMLTTKGVKITLAAREVVAQFYQTVLAGLTPREQDQLQKQLTTLHEISCAPGKRLACDRPGDIETVYANQSVADPPH